MLKNAKCTKTMETDGGLPLFRKGKSYRYREPTDDELEDFGCSYVFYNEYDHQVMMSYSDVTEYF